MRRQKTNVGSAFVGIHGATSFGGGNARVFVVSVPVRERDIQKIREGDRRDETIPNLRGNVANASHTISKTRGIVAAWRCLFFLPSRNALRALGHSTQGARRK